MMNHTHDLSILEDILPLFDYTLNPDSRSVLRVMLQRPLGSVPDIEERQSILRQIIACKPLWSTYDYKKIAYSDTYNFLSSFPLEKLKPVDYLTYTVKKKKRHALLGEYTQLIYFLAHLEHQMTEHIQVESFPETYQEELHFIIRYLSSFRAKHYKARVEQGKLGYRSIQKLNRIICEKRMNNETFAFFDKLNLLEAYISISKGAALHNFEFAEFKENTFQIIGLYHPLLAAPIKNNIAIDQHMVLLTGANMSGKSTLLKTLGLCVYLAHLGLPIPAEGGALPFYDVISIQINHGDDLKNGYSHFMNEMVKLREVVQYVHAGKRCFAVFDELFKGTNYEDALAISEKTIKGLSKFSTSTFFISTHIGELQHTLAEVSSRISPFYMDCEIRQEVPTFTYRLNAGWSDLRIGQILFKKEGLDDLLR